MGFNPKPAQLLLKFSFYRLLAFFTIHTIIVLISHCNGADIDENHFLHVYVRGLIAGAR
jgi:hypothetical protein